MVLVKEQWLATKAKFVSIATSSYREIFSIDTGQPREENPVFKSRVILLA